MAVATDAVVLTDARPRRRFRRLSVTGAVAVALLLLIVLTVVAGPMLWQQDPLAQQLDARLQSPSRAHPVGTDQFGRDLLARLLEGGRWTLIGAALVCLGVNLIGFSAGALAASGSRLMDGFLGRLLESLMALPGLVTALALTAVLGPSFRNLLIALVVTSWPWYARAYRSILIKERTAPYVEGAAALGASRLRSLLRHVLPNVVGPAVVLATANLGGVMLGLAALSFLGLGRQPPAPEWGVMINDARVYFQRYPWQMIAPGLCIVVTVLAVNLTGDALRDLLDPRGHGRRR
jgi:ABC-type dipeptide/oligopeptide/nickel transport system permease subunit